MKKLGRKRVHRYPLDFRTKIIRIILEGGMGILECSRHYGLSSQTIYNWLNEMESSKDKEDIGEGLEGKEADLSKEVRRLEEELRLERLRSESYREMIKQAESHFNILIEKKSGSKPSQR